MLLWMELNKLLIHSTLKKSHGKKIRKNNYNDQVVLQLLFYDNEDAWKKQSLDLQTNGCNSLR